MLTLEEQYKACCAAKLYWNHLWKYDHGETVEEQEEYRKESLYWEERRVQLLILVDEKDKWQKRHDDLVQELTSSQPQDNLSTTQTK